MKASGGPQKLRFAILSSSGEDTDYPVRELLYHSPQTRGWQCPRFAQYPQEIILKLEFPSKVQQIQILSHEYKIATKVEVFVGSPQSLNEETNAASYKRLGYLSFDSNERSNHQARELKSVHVNVHASHIKLVVHRCHVNKLNIYNQVGLIALNLIGEASGSSLPGMPPGGYLQVNNPASSEGTYYNASAAEMADLKLDMNVDTVTASKIREMARAKEAAVGREDYDEAKRIKSSIDRLKVVGQAIAKLEAKKRLAVEREEYDVAKILKVDIDKLRAAGESAAGAVNLSGGGGPPGGGSGTHRSKDPDEIFNRVLKGGAAHGNDDLPARPSGAAAAHNEYPPDPELIESGDVPDFVPPPTKRSLGGGANRDSTEAGKSFNYDERPAAGRNRYTPEGGHLEEEAELDRTKSKKPAAVVACDIPAPPGWPTDLSGPESIPAGPDAQASDPFNQLAGEYVTRALFSKSWQLRDAAIIYMTKQAGNGEYDGKGKDVIFKTLSKAAQRGMGDKVANVFLSSVALFKSIIDSYGAAVGSSTVQSACQSCLPTLIEKLGDNTTKIRDASKETVLMIASLEDSSVAEQLLKPVKNQSAWRPVLGVLEVLQELIPKQGIAKASGGRSNSFDLPSLMEWLGKAFGSANADVRSTAIKVTKLVNDIVGAAAVRKYLPKALNPKTKEQIDEAIGGDAGPPEAPDPPPPAAKANNASIKKAPAAKAPPSASSNPKPTSARAPSARAQSRIPPAAGGGADAVASATGDNPAPYLAELTHREKQFGKDHPRVAETCSNLAILYNQQGQGVKALPLYERALAIYEKAHGPEHPDVAHTLTDLAVLHLEQGNEEVGRPLLERALDIQERSLGPDHPDVLAIKDVLNS